MKGFVAHRAELITGLAGAFGNRRRVVPLEVFQHCDQLIDELILSARATLQLARHGRHDFRDETCQLEFVSRLCTRVSEGQQPGLDFQ